MGQFCLADGLFGSTARRMPHVVHFHSVHFKGTDTIRTRRRVNNTF